jgi:AraC-like DNA-binding protein
MFIEQNYQNEITLKQLADAAGFSEYHFSRVFKEITEKNIHQYLSEFRIKKLKSC